MYSEPPGGYASAMKATRKQGRALVVVAIVATAGIAAAAAWYFAGGGKRFGPAGPVRSLVPGDAAVYVEMRGAADLWDSVASSEAATDFAMSHTQRSLMTLPAVRDARALLDEITTQAQYELTATNLKKLFGREVAVGIVPRADGRAPDCVLVSKIDVAALAKDLLTGDADFSKLHDVIDARTGRCEFTVSRTEHRGVAVSRATKGAAAFSFTLVGDALVVAGDAALVTRSIDAYLDDGKGSIAQVPTFTEDTAKVPATAPILEWYDLDRMRANRASVTAGIDALGDGVTSAAAVDHVLDGASDIRTIARATELPGGNPYDMKWTWSRGAVDGAGVNPAPQRALAATLLPDAPIYAEIRGVAELMASWDRSAIARKLADGYLGRQFDKFVARPDSFSRGLGGGRLLTGIAGLEELDRAEPAHDTDEQERDSTEWQPSPPSFGTFELKTFLRMARRVTEELAGSSIGVAFAKGDGAGSPDIAVATRVNDGTRLMLLVVEGAVLAHGGCSLERHGDARILVGGDDAELRVAIAHAAGHAILASSPDVARRAIDALTSPAPAAPSPRMTALGALDANAHMVFHMQSATLLDAMGEMDDLGPAADAMASDYAMSARVEGDFEAVRFRYRAGHGKKPADFMLPVRPTPACHGVLAADPFLHTMAAVDLAAMWRYVESLIPDASAMFADLSGGFRDASGVDLAAGFLPAIGPEFAISVHRSEPVEPNPHAPEGPPVVGIILAVEMQQPEIVRKATEGLLATAQRAIDERAEANGGASQQIFAREKVGATDVITLSMPDAGMPVTPALAFHGSFLLIASDERMIRRCIAAGQPGGASLGASRALVEATRSLPRGSTLTFLDWNGMLDQFAEYAPQFGALLPEEESSEDEDPAPSPPEYPDNPRDRRAIEAWQKEMAAYQDQVAARGAVRVRRWIDAARVIDVIASTSGTSDGADHADLLIRFAK